MPRLIWSPAALLDVQRLYRFLLLKNPDAAKRAVRAIRQGVRVLEQQPGVGRPIDDMPEEFRELQRQLPVVFSEQQKRAALRKTAQTHRLGCLA